MGFSRIEEAIDAIREGRIVIEHADGLLEHGPLRADTPAAAQVAAALCAFGLAGLDPRDASGCATTRGVA